MTTAIDLYSVFIFAISLHNDILHIRRELSLLFLGQLFDVDGLAILYNNMRFFNPWKLVFKDCGTVIDGHGDDGAVR